MPKKTQTADELAAADEQILKQFGPGAVFRLNDQRSVAIDGISTGCLSLDLALGGSGLPRGRIAELFGPESSGKSTLALHVVAECQKRGLEAAFIDAEHCLDCDWAQKLGVDLGKLRVCQPSSGEEALQIADMYVRSKRLGVIVIDSVAALVPKAEVAGEIGDSHVGLLARLMSQAMRKLTEPVGRSGTSLIFINQIREKVGVRFGSPEVQPGGRALKFFTSIRLDIRRIGYIEVDDQQVGIRVRAKVVKNKIAAPYRIAEFDMLYRSGISAEGDILDLALADRIVEQKGSWFSFGDMRLGQGREKVREFLEQNTDEYHALRAAVETARGVTSQTLLRDP